MEEIYKPYVSMAQATALQELNYDEPCMCVFIHGIPQHNRTLFNVTNDLLIAPTYQEAFIWFMKRKYHLDIWMEGDKDWVGHCSNRSNLAYEGHSFNTWYDAANYFLNRLIHMERMALDSEKQKVEDIQADMPIESVMVSNQANNHHTYGTLISLFKKSKDFDTIEMSYEKETRNLTITIK